MNELKTLKDLRFEVDATGVYATVWDAVDYNVARLEAITWIKAIDNLPKKGQWKLGNFDRGDSMIDFAELRNWIKYFFGISEKELEE